ncbi:hypothetical protein C8Q79DRAFT_1011027 [Trametes meyenii]|nr:hypothetical protein C8Q79DRAFT_1011027 [Trametes meyenii]
MSTTSGTSTITAANIIDDMNRSLGALQETLGSLNESTVAKIRTDGEELIQKKIRGIRKELDVSEKRQQTETKQINGTVSSWQNFVDSYRLIGSSLRIDIDLLQKVLEEEVVRELTDLVKAGVLEEIDDLVRDQVKAQLPQHIPESLQAELRQHQEELARLERELQNSESARANATLRVDQVDAALHPFYNGRGQLSEHFPKTLGELFNMTDDTAVLLMHDFDLDLKAHDSREKKVNELMQLFGIRYRLISFNGGPAIPCSPTTATSTRRS